MLIKCPECDLQISDKALSCPHCGYPLQSNTTQKQVRKSHKRRRLPNGFGQISEIKNQNLRNPFRAMVTIGKTPTGRPICKPLKPDSYFATYNDAYAALVEYNKNPYDLAPSITVAQLYEKWFAEYSNATSSKANARTTSAAWNYCSSVYTMRVLDLRARHIKGCIDDGIAIINAQKRHASTGTRVKIKSVFNLMLDYAVEYEIVDRNYARTFNISDDILNEQEKNRKGHIPFTDDEMQTLWKHLDAKNFVDVILIQCYTGFRPQELGLLRVENVNFGDGIIMGGMKTDAGTNRIVPIHDKIMPLLEKRYQDALSLGSEYLINCTDTNTIRSNQMFTYDKYHKRFNKIITELKLDPQHRAHDGRMHFITMAKKYMVDEYAIKYIVGHIISDVTEKIYTKRETDWLRSEIAKIK